ncbi:hypothetical protein ACS0TY_019182 [Phlomoides rotata]
MPLAGRKFTWYRPDGTCKSRLDRILVNSEWITRWPNQVLKGERRTLSDHCPIYMESAIKNWGPRPFRFINTWVKHPQFKHFFESKWCSYQVHGWTAFRLKEKLKSLRNDLKVWNREVFGQIDQNISEKQREIETWDRIDDTLGLEENEVIDRNRCSAELLRYSLWKENQLFQQSKTKWLLEGDVNSGYFHGCINKRRKENEMAGLYFDGVWSDSVEDIRQGVRSNFLKQFKSPLMPRLHTPRSLFVSRMDVANNQFLTAQFLEDEVKEAIWSCDSYRSPGPDGRSGVCNDIYKVIGNGEGTDFWRDIWAGDVPLCENFNRLYRLSTQREDRVGDMGIWEEPGWRWDFKWRRGLRGRETEEVNILIACIYRNIPRREEQDQWRWRHSVTGCFSTKTAYQQHRDGYETGSVTELRRIALNRLWGCHAPRRYQVIIWKLLHERMPTRDKLKLIGIIPETEVARCSWGCSAEEDVYHLFFTCQVVWQIW